MVAIPPAILTRAKSWPSTPHAPWQRPGYVCPIVREDGAAALGYAIAKPIVAGVDEGRMAATAVISTIERDRTGDEVVPEGAVLDYYRNNPVVCWAHQQYPLPIGRAEDESGNLALTIEPGRRILATTFFSQKLDMAVQVFSLIVEKIVRATSIGFNPLVEPERLGEVEGSPQAGFRFPRWEMLEFSWCIVPMNGGCTILRSYLSRGKIAGDPINPVLRKSLELLAEPTPIWSPSGFVAPAPAPAHKPQPPADPVRWNKNLSPTFDVAGEQVDPSTMLYDWVSRHIGCPVKLLHQNGDVIPAARMGSFLTGLKNTLAPYLLNDVRNLDGHSESPPVYETIQLNSRQRDMFLVDGTAFYSGERKFVLHFAPSWRGLSVRVFTHKDDREFNQALLDQAHVWAKANNFLRGEAFSLGGEFLERTNESWDDVFLEERNKVPLKRTLDLLNQKGQKFANRGMIFSGPPGTGKTLSGRIIRNQAKATFIWIAARDFHYSGGFGGMAYAFDLAKELSPAVLFFEDVDNWLGGSEVDFLKSEMDGIARSAGVLTILTTNFPERLPEALIDRPGRFHDVLHFALPTEKARREMLAKWLADVPGADVEAAVRATDGMSGAHVYELAQFARTLQEHDGLPGPQALSEALRKVEEQRDLITEVQLQGSRYRPKALPGPVVKCGGPGSGQPGPCPEGGGDKPASGSSDKPAAESKPALKIPTEPKDVAELCAKANKVMALAGVDLYKRAAPKVKEAAKKAATQALEATKSIWSDRASYVNGYLTAPVDSYVFSTMLHDVSGTSGATAAATVISYAVAKTWHTFKNRGQAVTAALAARIRKGADAGALDEAAALNLKTIQALAKLMGKPDDSLPSLDQIKQILEAHAQDAGPEESEKTMSKRWGKGRSKKAAKPAMRKDGLNEGSATAGGATVPPAGGSAPPAADQHKRLKDAIAGVMDQHKDAAGDGAHDAYLHAGESRAYHVHAEGADAEHLKRVKDGLGAIDGMKAVDQGPAAPEGDGYEKVYGEGVTKPEGTPAPPTPGETGETRRLNAVVERLMAFVPAGERTKAAAAAVAAVKDMDAPVQDDLDAVLGGDEAGGGKGPGEDADSDLPHGAQCAQGTIEYIEGCLSNLEPEVREFWEGVLEQVSDWAAERYPDLDVGGTEPDTTAEDETSADDEEETEEALEPYQQQRRTVARIAKQLGNKAIGCVKAAADHLHDLSDLEEGKYSKSHRKACKMHARDLDALHGAISHADALNLDPPGQDAPAPKGETPPAPPEKPQDKPADAPEDKGLDLEQIGAALASLESRSGKIDTWHQRMTGKSLTGAN